MASRPLSPHLSIYRFAYTMALSIAHRISGLGLSIGLVLLVAWLFALARGAAAHEAFARFIAAWPAKVLLALFVVAFCYHLANGVRHLVWDTGRGLERHQARASAKLVVAFTVLSSALLIYLFLFSRGSAP
jgi:succinate dehydrogenase / fumarate reductase cytochrome b subunit